MRRRWAGATSILREALAAATGLPVQIENSGRACALAQAWAMRDDLGGLAGDLVFVSVSDGVGVGVMIHGEVLRGRHNIAGEFGHLPLSLDGPRCSCGSNGCWEAYVSNPATLARYFGRPSDQRGPTPVEQRHFTVEDLIARARARDAKASAALDTTARYLGLGLASVINVLDPARVYVGGEITLAWDLIESTVRAALAERALTPAAAETDIRPVAATEYPRLRGAAALVRRAGVRRARCRVETDMSTWNLHSITPDTCIVRNTASQKGRTLAIAPGTTAASRHLHYGRIILDAGDAPIRSRPATTKPASSCLRGSAIGDGRRHVVRRWAATTRSMCRATRRSRSRPARTAAISPRSRRRSSKRHPVQHVRFADVQAGSRPALQRRRRRRRSAISTC